MLPASRRAVTPGAPTVRNLLTVLTACSLLLLLSCGKTSQQAPGTSSMKIGLVFDVGGRGDKSFNDAAFRGLEEARQELGITYEYIEPGPGGLLCASSRPGRTSG